MENRRTARRTVTTFLVQHQSSAGDHLEVDYATNLSRGGLFLQTRRPLAPMSTFHVQFAPQRDARLISAFCRVTHVGPDGVGAQFVSLDAESAALLDAALR